MTPLSSAKMRKMSLSKTSLFMLSGLILVTRLERFSLPKRFGCFDYITKTERCFETLNVIILFSNPSLPSPFQLPWEQLVQIYILLSHKTRSNSWLRPEKRIFFFILHIHHWDSRARFFCVCYLYFKWIRSIKGKKRDAVEPRSNEFQRCFRGSKSTETNFFCHPNKWMIVAIFYILPFVD